MKYLRHYKIFEDIDEDDTVPDGFKYSWNDIYESLFYLTDIGFEIDEKSQKRYLADEKGNPIKGEYVGGYYNREWKSNIDRAKNAIYEIKLFKKKEGGKLYKNVSLGGYPSRDISYYLDSDVNGLLGKKSIIVKFDYQKVFDLIKKEISQQS